VTRVPEAISESANEESYVERAIEEVKPLLRLPPVHFGEAFMEKCFTYASTYYPVVDRQSFHPYESSKTLHNAIFLAGSREYWKKNFWLSYLQLSDHHS
jgi:hypothetical protein